MEIVQVAEDVEIDLGLEVIVFHFDDCNAAERYKNWLQDKWSNGVLLDITAYSR